MVIHIIITVGLAVQNKWIKFYLFIHISYLIRCTEAIIAFLLP
jgi:hypothetical protein